jgi:putative sterol carrier protein
MAKFPTDEWIVELDKKLNTDPAYARIAHNWEWDLKFVIEPGGPLSKQVVYYLDLWHGKCRKVEQLTDSSADKPAAFVLRAPYENFTRILTGKLDPLQAMITRKLFVQGPMIVMMRNVPTVMDFVRCAREITDSYV